MVLFSIDWGQNIKLQAKSNGHNKFDLIIEKFLALGRKYSAWIGEKI